MKAFFIHFRSAKIFYLLTNSRTSAKGTWTSRGRMTFATHWRHCFTLRAGTRRGEMKACY